MVLSMVEVADAFTRCVWLINLTSYLLASDVFFPFLECLSQSRVGVYTILCIIKK